MVLVCLFDRFDDTLTQKQTKAVDEADGNTNTIGGTQCVPGRVVHVCVCVAEESCFWQSIITVQIAKIFHFWGLLLQYYDPTPPDKSIIFQEKHTYFQMFLWIASFIHNSLEMKTYKMFAKTSAKKNNFAVKIQFYFSMASETLPETT